MAMTPYKFGSRYSVSAKGQCAPKAQKRGPKHSTARLMLHAKLARNIPIR